MYALTYIENNTFCILLMLVIWKCQRENLDKRRNARVFQYLLCSMMVYACFDFLCERLPYPYRQNCDSLHFVQDQDK